MIGFALYCLVSFGLVAGLCFCMSVAGKMSPSISSQPQPVPHGPRQLPRKMERQSSCASVFRGLLNSRGTRCRWKVCGSNLSPAASSLSRVKCPAKPTRGLFKRLFGFVLLYLPSHGKQSTMGLHKCPTPDVSNPTPKVVRV